MVLSDLICEDRLYSNIGNLGCSLFWFSEKITLFIDRMNFSLSSSMCLNRCIAFFFQYVKIIMCIVMLFKRIYLMKK